MATETTEHTLLPKQDEFLFSSDRHTLYSGAVGAGKSRSLCIGAALHVAGRPNARFGLFRKTLTGLKKSTLKTLLEGDGDAPPILPHGSYDWNKSEREVKVHGGGTILYNGVETPESVRSMNLSQAGVDEVTELTFEDYAAIDDRVRIPLDGEPLRILSATNPAMPSHWLAKMMGISPEKQTPDPDCRIIMTCTADNTYLPDAYLRSFERHKGTLYYDKMFLGKWVGAEGLVYADFYRDTHVMERPASEAKSWHYAIDPGYTDPFTILEIMKDGDGRFHIAREWYRTRDSSGRGATHKEALGVLGEMVRDRSSEIIIDSAEPSFIEAARGKGFNAEGATKGQDSITAGISMVTERLRPAGDGKPRLTVSPECTNTIREFESYEWEEGRGGLKEKPVDRDNHTMDALRYLVMKHDSGHSFMAVEVVGDEDEYDTW